MIEGNALTVLATVELSRGRPARAVDHVEQALAVHIDTGLRLGQARTRMVAAEALLAAGRPLEADTTVSRPAIYAEMGVRGE